MDDPGEELLAVPLSPWNEMNRSLGKEFLRLLDQRFISELPATTLTFAFSSFSRVLSTRGPGPGEMQSNFIFLARRATKSPILFPLVQKRISRQINQGEADSRRTQRHSIGYESRRFSATEGYLSGEDAGICGHGIF